ncbi:MAG: AI-2E family transporter [Gemmatimonadota bacterium]|jgi:predicted PurR-regulated permease PerM
MTDDGGTGNSAGTLWIGVLALAALTVLGFFLFALREVLNPFLLFLLLVAVLLPFRGRPGHALLVSLAALLTLFWILDTTGFLLAPFVLALVLAYVLDPAVDVLERRGLGRSLGIVLLALPVLGILIPAAVFGLPSLGEQVADLIGRVPTLISRLATWIEGLDERVAALSLPPAAQGLVDRLQEIDPQAVVTFLQERQAEIGRRAWEGVLGLGRGLGSVLSVLGYVVLTPVITFYLLRDWDRLTSAVADLLPRERRDEVLSFVSEYDHLLSRYLRGQVLVAMIIGSITALGLWVVGFPYAFLLGVLVAVFGLVPYLGLVLSLIPAVLIALVSGNVALSLVKVALVYGVAQALEGTVVSPRIVGESVGLHPVWVVFALAVGGFFFGFVGLLIGVPLAVGVKLLVERGLERYRSSPLYRGEGRVAETA